MGRRAILAHGKTVCCCGLAIEPNRYGIVARGISSWAKTKGEITTCVSLKTKRRRLRPARISRAPERKAFAALSLQS